MKRSYSRGYDLPPMLRDRLMENKSAAAGFAALSASRQDAVTESCGRMNSPEQIDDLIRQTDNFMFSEIVCSEASFGDSKLL